MKHLDVYIVLSPTLDELSRGMDEKVQDTLAFLRGLPRQEYGLHIHCLPDAARAGMQSRPSRSAFPLILLDGEILAAGMLPTFDEMSALLRLGCDDASEDSFCCTEADGIRATSESIRTRFPTLVADVTHEDRVKNTSGRRTVLFVCRHNSCRSQMAEAFLRHLAGDRFHVLSCGLASRPVHPLAVQVMAEVGIDIREQTSKTCREIAAQVSVACAIFVCHVDEDQCPAMYPFASTYLRKPFEDPTVATGSEDERLAVFRRVRDEIRVFVESLPGALGVTGERG